LAADLQRYLKDEAVEACPPSAFYRLRKFVRRNRRGLAAALVVLILAGSLGWIARDWQSRRAEAEGRAAEALAVAEPKLRAGNPHDPELVSAARKAEAQLAAASSSKRLGARSSSCWPT